MRCALTGAGGFIGGSLRRHFHALGWDVVPMSRAPEAGGVAFLLDQPVDPAALAGMDVLVHGAWDFRPARWSDIHRVNVEGTRALFGAASAAGIGRLVLISSMSAYPGCRSIYGRAKLECEAIALEHGAAIVRPGLVYGDPSGGLFGAMERIVRRSPIVPVITGGRQNIYTCHVEDLVALIAEMATGIAPPVRLVTAAHDRRWTMGTLVAAMARRAGVRRAILPVPWQIPFACLRLMEMLGRTGTFRSDSVLGLAWQNPEPDFAPLSEFKTRFRPYE